MCSKVMSLIFDESTDRGDKQNLLICVGYIKIGSYTTSFLAMPELQATSAEPIAKAIEDELQKFGITASKVKRATRCSARAFPAICFKARL